MITGDNSPKPNRDTLSHSMKIISVLSAIPLLFFSFPLIMEAEYEQFLLFGLIPSILFFAGSSIGLYFYTNCTGFMKKSILFISPFLFIMYGLLWIFLLWGNDQSIVVGVSIFLFLALNALIAFAIVLLLYFYLNWREGV
jgi:hypothetical protein